MTSKKPDFQRVDSILAGTLKGLNLEEKFRVYPVWKKWTEIVGETVSSRAQPDYVTGQTLVVSVTHPVWMNELELQKEILLSKINALDLATPIGDIRFRLRK
ncbi:MAG: DUF721 domain-containing protein [Deltaproteobacteria bacterium]|nr:DUF721 domain-containing protein [Deltaproteobacteria bacterium]